MTSTSLGPIAIEQVPIDQLRPDPANPRRISEDELDALERSLRQFGFVQPVLARREDRTVIGGHQRLVAARRLGLTTVPVTWLDVGVEQARLVGLALNKISGSWDDALLARLLADLQATPDVDLSLSGFGEEEVKDLLRSLETREKREHVESFDLDEALEEATRAPADQARRSLGPRRAPAALRTPSLELRVPTDDDLLALAAVARAGLHDEGEHPFLVPWDELPSPAFERQFLLFWWRTRGSTAGTVLHVSRIVIRSGFGGSGLTGSTRSRRR